MPPLRPKGGAKPPPAAKPTPSAKPAEKGSHLGGAPPRPRPAARGDYIPVAEVARPHGIQGELRLKIFNADSDLLSQRGVGARVKLRMPGGEERDVQLTTTRDANKALLVRISGVDDRNAAEALRGAELCVPRDAFPPLDDGEFYACDVEGARAVLRSGEEIGHVAGIASYPTCDVLLVERAGGGRLEVPLLPAYVGAVDVKGGVVELLTIEGLD